MPRPERPLDPTEGPIAEFAARLRVERERAGRPTYRAMARRAHRSQTTLSEAAGGRALPTWETTAAFLGACGVTDMLEWRSRWERCRDHVRGEPEEAAEQQEPLTRRPARRVFWMAAVSFGIVAVSAAITMFLVGMRPDTDQGGNARPRTAVSNGADPEDTGCANDSAVDTVDAREVDIDQVPIGVIELRYSPRCGASWPRFTPADPRYATITKRGPIDIDLIVIADDPQRTSASFTTRYVGLPVFGNMVNSTVFCVRAQAFLHGPGWRSGIGTTGCFRGAVAAQ